MNDMVSWREQYPHLPAAEKIIGFSYSWPRKTKGRMNVIVTRRSLSHWKELLTSLHFPFQYHPDRLSSPLAVVLTVDIHDGTRLIAIMMATGWRLGTIFTYKNNDNFTVAPRIYRHDVVTL